MSHLTSALQKASTSGDFQIFLKLSRAAYLIDQKFLLDLGVNEHTLRPSLVTFKLLCQFLNSNKGKNTAFFIKEVLGLKESFSFKHSFLIVILAAGVIDYLDVTHNGQMKESILEQLVFVAFFHDMLLKEDTHSKIHNKVELFEANLSEIEKENVISHANKMATIVQGLDQHIPTGVDILIRQHHGVSNGIGFADVYNSSLSPQAIIFIVLEHFATMLIYKSDKERMTDLLERLLEQMTLPSYRKVAEGLKQSFILMVK